MKRFGWLLALALLAQTPLACGDDEKDDESSEPDAGHEQDASAALSSGAACDDSLAYSKDIAPLVAKYCTRCHASTLSNAARMGAPADYNFDSEAGIWAVRALIDAMAGSGPTLSNTVMPPSEPRPSMAERATLSRYLACQR